MNCQFRVTYDKLVLVSLRLFAWAEATHASSWQLWWSGTSRPWECQKKLCLHYACSSSSCGGSGGSSSRSKVAILVLLLLLPLTVLFRFMYCSIFVVPVLVVAVAVGVAALLFCLLWSLWPGSLTATAQATCQRCTTRKCRSCRRGSVLQVYPTCCFRMF